LILFNARFEKKEKEKKKQRNFQRPSTMTTATSNLTSSQSQPQPQPKPASECESTIQTEVLSAGFIFYSYAPDTNNVYFLLGMDDYSNKWSDFGGRKQPDEPESLCAVREMLEETLNVVRIPKISQHSFDVTVAELVQMIQNKEYLFRIGYDINENTNGKKRHHAHMNHHTSHQPHISHHTSHQPIHHQDKYTNRDHDHYHTLSHTSNHTVSQHPSQYHNHHHNFHSYNPSHQLAHQTSHPLSHPPPRSISHPMVLENDSSSSCIRPPFRSLCGRGNECLVRKLRVCYVKRIDWQPEIVDQFQETYLNLCELKRLKDPGLKLKLWNSLPSHVRFHPALTFHYDAENNVKNVFVKTEWTENQQIGWWSLPRLKYVIRNGGQYKKHIFRQGFLPTLEIILDEFDKKST
jgi:hypothetical protein